MVDSFLKNNYRANFEPGKTLPKVSTKLDSIRSYQFEVKFFGLPPEFTLQQQELTAAAKQVSPIGGSVDDIVVDRLNDKVFYPGKFTPENVTITFDNQLLTNNTPAHLCILILIWGVLVLSPIRCKLRHHTCICHRCLPYRRRRSSQMMGCWLVCPRVSCPKT